MTITYAFEKAINPNETITFNITEFRNPPSTETINFVSVQTLDNLGNIVDHSDGGSFKVSLPDIILASNIRIIPQVNTINAITNYDITYRI